MKPLQAVALVAVLAFAPAGGADETPVPPVFSSDVALVMLPVFVVDRDGRSVRGLQAADFDVEEDGRRAELVSFRYVDTTDADGQDELREAHAARRRFVLLFDHSFTDIAGLQRAQEAAADLVRSRLAPSDLAAVATFDVHNGLRLRANFTADRAVLARAIAGVRSTRLVGISDPLALAADVASVDLMMPAAQGNTQLDTSGLYRVLVDRMRAAEVEAYRGYVLTLVGAWRDLAEAMRGVHGRKQILYFSAGFDSRLLIGESGEEQRRTAQSSAAGRLWEIDPTARFGDTTIREAIREVTRDLTRADAVVHSVDVTGLGRDRSLTQQHVTLDPHRDTGGRESLNLLAAETGGRLFKDANDLGAAMGEMLEMTSRYYVLGFQPRAAREPGAFHKVKVKVARRGVKLSHRPGYHERVPLAAQPALQRQFEVAQLVMGGMGPNDLRFATLCLPFPSAGERQDLGLVVQVPAEGLGSAAALEVYAYAVDEGGRIVDYIAQFARFDAGRATSAAEGPRGLSLHGTLSVPPGQYTIRMMVVERDSGASGVQVLEVTVPPFDGGTAFLLPPMVLDDAARWATVEMRRATAGRPAPFRVGGEPFVPRATFEVTSGALEKLVLVSMDRARPGDPASDLQLRSSLTRDGGEVVNPGSIRIVKVDRHAGGRRTYLLDYRPEALAPGGYTLRIALEEGGERVESYARLRVRGAS